MDGNSPYPPGYGAPLPQSGQPPASGLGYVPLPPQNLSPSTAAARPRTVLLASGVVLAVLLGVAALVLSIINILTKPGIAPTAKTPQGVEAQELFVNDADKALCEAVGPLMRAETDRTNAFLDTGDPDSPARKAAIPKFKADTLDWAARIQKSLNEHADPPRYLTRTLQEFIDGMLLYSENLHADRGADAFDKPTYDSAIVAGGGPLATCYKVGAGW